MLTSEQWQAVKRRLMEGPLPVPQGMLAEILAVEYRIATQNAGRAPDKLLVGPEIYHAHGSAVFEEFKREVAPNITIQVSAFCPARTMFFLDSSALGFMTRRMDSTRER